MFEQKTIKVNEKEYVLQKLPIRKALEIRQKWTLSSGLTDDVVMADEVFKHIVVEPKVKLDDFEDVAEVEEIVAQAVVFQYVEKQKKETSNEE